MTTVHAVAFPHNVEVAPGEGGVVSVTISNTSKVIDSYQVQVFGLDPAWVQVTPQRLSLFPGDTQTAEIRVTLPADYPSSQRMISVNVVSDDDPTSFNLSNIELVVSPRAEMSIELDPTMVTGGKSATFGIVVSNDGNAVAQANGFAVDPEELAEFTFDPPSVVVPPGRNQVIRVTAQGGRSWFGQIRARTFTFGIRSDLVGSSAGLSEEVVVETVGTFLQRPRIGRWMMSLMGLLTAAAVFAAVLSRTFDSVVDEAAVTDELIDAALSNDEAGGAVIPTDPGTLTGTIGAATGGGGLAGVQAELFVPGDLTTPVASGVTDEAGSFSLSNLAAGTYKLKLSGAGLEPLWYPAGQVASEGQDIVIGKGESSPLEPVAVGGLPVEVGGSIEAEDPADLSGVMITLVAESGLAVDGDALVASVAVSPDGTFTLEDVPSPGVYELLVEKPGFATERRTVVVEPGEGLGDLELSLQPGNGIVAGSVTDERGQPLGGVTISATDQVTTVETVSLTEGAVGTFRVRNLPTPAQYTVTISRPGYISETRTVALSEGQLVGNFNAQLVPAIGEINGRATIDGVPEQGLSVTLTGGDVVRTTAVVSQGPAAGSFGFNQLPAPGTYTLTFSGANVIPQVRVIDINPFSGSPIVSGVDVSLSPERTVVRGTVSGVGGDPEPQATVILSDGTNVYTFLTADEPAGEFEFSDVSPGAYTLTASRSGTDPVVRLVNVSPTAGAPIQNLQLGRQASLNGRVDGFDSTARSVTLRLFLPEQFPNGDSLDVTQTDATGAYTFLSLDAPTTYVVAVYVNENAADPLDSVAIETQPSDPKTVPAFTVSLPS